VLQPCSPRIGVAFAEPEKASFKENSMTDSSLGVCNPRQTKEFIFDALEAGLVPFVRSSPGAGKSSIVRQIADHFGLVLIDHRLSTSVQEDMTGIPYFVDAPNGYKHARFAPFSHIFPLQGMPIPEGKNGWLIFFDEFNSASEQVQAACYKVILDRMIGLEYLHENVAIVCAGNLETDRAITTQMSTAMQSRLVNLEMQVDFRCWLEDVALKEGYDFRIIGFLSQWNSKLMDFRPDHNEKTFCCPRTWEFMNRLVKGKEFRKTEDSFEMERKMPLYGGTITSGVAVEFVQFCKIATEVIKIHEIIGDPDNCRLPMDNVLKWATISSMIEHINEKNFGPLSVYGDRFEVNFRVLFYRSVLAKHPKLQKHPAYAKAALELMKYLSS
jgi:hypothetical protein